MEAAMSHEHVSGRFRFLPLVILVVLLLASAPAEAQQPVSRQIQVLADLAARILTCSVHPCLGESEKDVRRLLKGKVLSDGIFNYSDLAVAYPVTKDVLHGLVEWEFSHGLGMVGLKVVDFHVPPSVLIAQVEQTLPGCEMDQEGSDAVLEGADRDDQDDETQQWRCWADAEGTDGVLVEIYYVPGLLLFEIGS